MNPVKGSRRKAAVALASAVAVVTVAGGAAYAYITLTATNSATAAEATVNQPVISALTIEPMLPGTERKVSFTLDNPNDFPIKLTSIKRSTPATVTGGGNCGVAQLTGALATNVALPFPGEPTVAAGATGVEYEVEDALGLAETATAACGVSFDVTVTALQQGN